MLLSNRRGLESINHGTIGHSAHCQTVVVRYDARMTDELTTIVLHAIERAPQWVKRDLDSKDHVIRTQAEESLAAMIAEAWRKKEASGE